ncbi:hypothetical protein AX14_006869 [Amanita brunnescens Koide BX004]|nr:hypothetical protein AX14_006869 [Amanita brunnescens Koide BX004]
MGSLCSKQGNHSGTQYAVPLERPAHRQALDADAQRPSNPRAAAAAAAEQRLKAARARGTNTSNPNQGKLAAQLAKQSKYTPEARQEEQLVWD